MSWLKRSIRWVRRWRAALLALAWLLLAEQPFAAAAELRLGFDDLAVIIGRLAPSWSARVTTDEGDRGGDGSHHIELEMGRAAPPSLAIRLPLPAIQVAAGVYRAAPLTDLTGTLAVRAETGGLSFAMRPAGSVVFTVACIKGACPPQSVLPDVVWHAPSLEANVGAGATGQLLLQRLAVGGTFAAACNRSWFSGRLVCEALCPVIEAAVRDRVVALEATTAGAPAQKAGSAAKGLAADLRVAAILADESGVRVSFCIAPDCQ